MTPDPPGSILALQAAHRDQAAYIRRLEQTVKDLFTVIRNTNTPYNDLPMVDLIHDLLEEGQDP